MMVMLNIYIYTASASDVVSPALIIWCNSGPVMKSLSVGLGIFLSLTLLLI